MRERERILLNLDQSDYKLALQSYQRSAQRINAVPFKMSRKPTLGRLESHTNKSI